MSEAVMRPPEAAKYLGLSTSTLAKMRLRGDGPVYLKLGKRTVAYRRVDLDAFLAQNLRRSTCEIVTSGAL
jgi:predicted DNA-binding transcriptional regulator AlpA